MGKASNQKWARRAARMALLQRTIRAKKGATAGAKKELARLMALWR